MPDKATLRTDLSAQAHEWVDYITTANERDIKWSILNSRIYSPDFQAEAPAAPTRRISLMDTDSVNAFFAIRPDGIVLDGEPTILNFASYKYPGGMFLDGSTAQEEALCHRSTLFSVLDAFDSSYYVDNRFKLNRGLYTNRAIFSPGIMFYSADRSEYHPANVLTCASPNWLTASKYNSASKSENNRVVKERLKFMNQILATEKVHTFIAGAWGCGVFRQDPTFMAKAMIEELTYPEQLIFAIPKGNNYNAFQAVLEDTLCKH